MAAKKVPAIQNVGNSPSVHMKIFDTTYGEPYVDIRSNTMIFIKAYEEQMYKKTKDPVAVGKFMTKVMRTVRRQDEVPLWKPGGPAFEAACARCGIEPTIEAVRKFCGV